MDIEIKRNVQLDDSQGCLLDMHSFLNVLNVLIGELELLGIELEDTEGAEAMIGLAESLKLAMETTGADDQWLDRIRRLERMLDASLDVWTVKLPDKVASAAARESIANIRSVLTVLSVRLSEFTARKQLAGQWVRHRIATLESNFRKFFTAVELNSKGRYRIIYNIAGQEQRDYVVSLRIESPDGEYINMPPEVQDVFRDLIANARKYTAPGGVITAGLREQGGLLRLVVEDNGMGIPEDEIEKVVDFGYRATNARARPTKGGGFGLTKAYMVTRAHGGRFFIRSSPGAGTRITIELPLPAACPAGTPGPVEGGDGV